MRILKQPPHYTFKAYPEGDLLDHVLANQPRFLAVFAVVREWHRLGKPRLESADHDFRPWARNAGVHLGTASGGLVTCWSGTALPQQCVASPGLTWLRDLAIAVHKAGQVELWLRPHHLLKIIADAGLETPGVELNALDAEHEWLKATQAIGDKLAKLFKDVDVVDVDGGNVERREALDEQRRPRTDLWFSRKPRIAPNSTPNENPRLPSTPKR